MYTCHSNPVDLLVRTSGEVRLSDFLLWQVRFYIKVNILHTCELIFISQSSTKTTISFIDKLWPEFTIWNFYAGLLNYQINNKYMNNDYEKNKAVVDINLDRENRLNKFLSNLYLKNSENIINLAQKTA